MDIKIHIHTSPHNALSINKANRFVFFCERCQQKRWTYMIIDLPLAFHIVTIANWYTYIQFFKIEFVHYVLVPYEFIRGKYGSWSRSRDFARSLPQEEFRVENNWMSIRSIWKIYLNNFCLGVPQQCKDASGMFALRFFCESQ